MQFPFLLGAGALNIAPLLQGLTITQPTEQILQFLLLDLPNLIDSEGGEIWQYDFDGGADGQGNWTKVLGSDLQSGLIEDGDIGIRDLEVFDGALYAATSTNLIFNFLAGGDGAAKLLVSETGEAGSFVELDGGPLDVEGTTSIRALTKVTLDGEDFLLVGTENVQNGAQVWSYDTNGNWLELAKFDGDAYAASISEIEQINGEIIIGTWLPYKLYAVSPDGNGGFEDRTPVLPSSPVDDNGVMQIKLFDEYVYVSSVNYAGGASLYRIPIDDFKDGSYDSTKWETITTDGFRDTNLNYYYDSDNPATYVWQLEVVGDVLYFGDFSNKATLGQITHAGAGKTPVLALIPPDPSAPFSFDDGPAYGIRKLLAVQLDADGNPTVNQATPNALLIGTADDFNARPNQNLIGEIFDPAGEYVIANPLLPNELIGSDEEDLIIGSLFGDRIIAGGEDDIIFADLLGFGLAGVGVESVGGKKVGADTIDGGSGQDVIFAMGGHDSVKGGAGEDFIVGGEGRDTIRGGAGIDLISGDGVADGPLGPVIRPLLDGLLAGVGDAVEGIDLGAVLDALLMIDPRAEAQGRLDDLIYGNGGNDIIIAGGGDDRVFGGGGNDGILDLTGDDVLNGGTGDDVLDGGAGDDIMRGGKGNDVLITGLGDDRMFGNAGNDRYLVTDDDDDPTTITTGNDTIIGFDDGDVIDLSAFFQNPFGLGTISNLPLPPQLQFNFDLQIKEALTVTGDGVLIDLADIDGGLPGVDTFIPVNPMDPQGAKFPAPPTGSGTILVRGVSELTASDFVVNTLLLADGLDLLT